jgi:hypothetical protein
MWLVLIVLAPARGIQDDKKEVDMLATKRTECNQNGRKSILPVPDEVVFDVGPSEREPDGGRRIFGM